MPSGRVSMVVSTVRSRKASILFWPDVGDHHRESAVVAEWWQRAEQADAVEEVLFGGVVGPHEQPLFGGERPDVACELAGHGQRAGEELADHLLAERVDGFDAFVVGAGGDEVVLAFEQELRRLGRVAR